MSEKIDMNSLSPGLYRVFWVSGGSSEVAIGMGANGVRWIAPTNWVSPIRADELPKDMRYVERVESLSVGRLVPRMQPDHVPLTEILSGVIATREDIAARAFDHGVRISDVHADVRCIKSMVQALAGSLGERQEAHTRALGHNGRVAGDLVLMVKDVGEKVEAVLSQVTPCDKAEPADTAESEADHWKRLYSSAAEAVEKHKTTIRHEREHVGKLQSQIAGLKDELGDVMAERDEWHYAYDKLVSDVLHGRKHTLPAKVAVDECGGKAEPVTDESGVSVGAGVLPSTATKIGIDPAKPGSDKTVIRFHQPEGSCFLHPPAWAGPICDTTIFGGSLIVACQNGVFRLDGDRLTPLRFVAG